MSIVARFAPPSLTTEQYDESLRRIQEVGDWPPDGLEYHVYFGPEGNLRVSEIWDSREQFDAFGERLMPVLAEVGIEPGEPEVLEVHNTPRPSNDGASSGSRSGRSRPSTSSAQVG